jgi:hypothetical protein
MMSTPAVDMWHLHKVAAEREHFSQSAGKKNIQTAEQSQDRGKETRATYF